MIKRLNESNLYDKSLINVAKKIVDEQKASISFIQRQFLFGYPKAKSIIDEFLALGYIEKEDSLYRVIINKEDFYKTNPDIK